MCGESPHSQSPPCCTCPAHVGGASLWLPRSWLKVDSAGTVDKPPWTASLGAARTVERQVGQGPALGIDLAR
jgi:hypothetical protein